MSRLLVLAVYREEDGSYTLSAPELGERFLLLPPPGGRGVYAVQREVQGPEQWRGPEWVRTPYLPRSVGAFLVRVLKGWGFKNTLIPHRGLRHNGEDL